MSETEMLKMAALAGLEQAINRYLELDPETLTRIQALQGRCIAVELIGTGMTLYLLPDQDGLRLMSRYEGEPDTTLSGTPIALARMSAGETGTGMFTGEVKIHGDVELGQRFNRIMDSIDIDWEEHLSHIMGDVLAHQAGKLMRGFSQWARQAVDHLGRDLADYLKEERRDLPQGEEVEAFLAEVDELRLAVDRLAARVARAEKLMKEKIKE